jgi:hypothetical protein
MVKARYLLIFKFGGIRLNPRTLVKGRDAGVIGGVRKFHIPINVKDKIRIRQIYLNPK